MLGVIPYCKELPYFSVSYLADRLFAKIITCEEKLNRTAKNIFIGSMSVARRPEESPLPGGKQGGRHERRSDDMIVAALESKAAALILTNDILPPSNLIEKAAKMGIPLLLVSADTYEIARQIDGLESLPTKDDTGKIALIAQMVRTHVDLEAAVPVIRCKMNPDVFREYDIRGVVDRDLDPDFVYLLGRAIGTYAVRHGVRKMTLGRDCRLSSEAYQDAVGRGIMTAGVDVTDIGLCATPMLYFSIRHFGTDGGVMVTGSHNPPDFNGFKICIGPDTIYGEEIQELRRIIEGGSFTTGSGTYAKKDISAAYEEHLFADVQVKPGLRIVLDGGNGVGGFFALPLLKRYGCLVTDIYCDPDGRFPHHFPDPTVPENLRELIRLVREKKADAGIAYDGDADRIGVITDRGDVLWGDELLLLFSRFILKKNPGAAIIGEVKCSQKLYDDIANRRRAANHVEGRSLADQGEDEGGKGAPRRRDERAHLLRRPVFRLRRCHLCIRPPARDPLRIGTAAE